jgi:hypothetical protein
MLLARVGILNWLEGRLGLSSYVWLLTADGDETGLQDLSVSAKAVIHRRASGAPAAEPRMTVLGGAILPTDSGDAGSNEVQPGARLLVDFAGPPPELVDRSGAVLPAVACDLLGVSAGAGRS